MPAETTNTHTQNDYVENPQDHSVENDQNHPIEDVQDDDPSFTHNMLQVNMNSLYIQIAKIIGCLDELFKMRDKILFEISPPLLEKTFLNISILRYAVKEYNDLRDMFDFILDISRDEVSKCHSIQREIEEFQVIVAEQIQKAKENIELFKDITKKYENRLNFQFAGSFL